MATECIDTFIVGLQLAEKNRVIAVDTISDILFRLACFLARLDRVTVENIAVNGFIGPTPVDLSPSKLFDWTFYKQGTVRDVCIDSISPHGNESRMFIIATSKAG